MQSSTDTNLSVKDDVSYEDKQALSKCKHRVHIMERSVVEVHRHKAQDPGQSQKQQHNKSTKHPHSVNISNHNYLLSNLSINCLYQPIKCLPSYPLKILVYTKQC